MGDTSGSNNQIITVKENNNISFQCPVLGATNYPIWSLRIKAIFKAHGLWEVIEPGTSIDPKKDNAAIAYLYQALPEELILQIAACETAREIWDSIKIRHLGVERVMEARLQSLKTEFDLIRMKDSDKVDDYVAKISGIASKSATLGAPIEEAALVRKLLTRVPDSYLNMVATIEQLVDLKTVKFQEIVGRLKAYEERTSSCFLMTNGKQGRSKREVPGEAEGQAKTAVAGAVAVEGQAARVEVHIVAMEATKPLKTRRRIGLNYSASGVMALVTSQQIAQQGNRRTRQTCAKQPKSIRIRPMLMSLHY